MACSDSLGVRERSYFSYLFSSILTRFLSSIGESKVLILVFLFHHTIILIKISYISPDLLFIVRVILSLKLFQIRSGLFLFLIIPNFFKTGRRHLFFKLFYFQIFRIFIFFIPINNPTCICIWISYEWIVFLVECASLHCVCLLILLIHWVQLIVFFLILAFLYYALADL